VMVPSRVTAPRRDISDAPLLPQLSQAIFAHVPRDFKAAYSVRTAGPLHA
jgi:hypothetical protein